MKKIFLQIVVTALLGALGFAQTPATSSTPDQINAPTAAAPAPVETAVPPAAPAAASATPQAPAAVGIPLVRFGRFTSN